MIDLKNIAENARLEDVRFTPSGKRLALIDFKNNLILIFDLEADGAENQLMRIHSPIFKSPHSISFINDQLFLVASRRSKVALFKIPHKMPGIMDYEISAEVEFDHPCIKNPSAVESYQLDDQHVCVLVGNLVVNYISRHILNLSTMTVSHDEIFIQKGVHCPDALSISSDQKLIAVSNHGSGEILLFKNDNLLQRNSSADQILEGLLYPHAIRFSPHDRYIVASDSGSPYLFLFENIEKGTRRRQPYRVVEVIESKNFIQNGNCEEGGAKGFDIKDSSVVVVSEYQHFKLLQFEKLLDSHSCSKALSDHLQQLAREAKKRSAIKIVNSLRTAAMQPARWWPVLQHTWRQFTRSWPN